MDATRYNSVQMAAESRLNDLFGLARSCKMSSRRMNELYVEILNTLPKGTPSKLKEYLRGMFKCHTNYLHRYDLEFCYVIDNVFCTTHKDSDKPYWDTVIKSIPKGTVCGHVWKGTESFYFKDVV